MSYGPLSAHAPRGSAVAPLRRSADFRRVLEGGRRLAGRRMVLYVLPGEQGIRIGFVTGQGLGGAVQRNRVRRRLKEAWRSMIPRLRDAHEIVVAGRPGVEDASSQELTAEMEGLLVMANVVRA